MWIAITMAAALLGGLLFQKIRVPAGLLLGAVVAVAALNIASGKANVWPQARVLSQIISGAYLGGMITKDELRLLPRITGPFVVIFFGFLALNIGAALLISNLTQLSLISCLFSAMPGGISDAPLIAMDMGADVAAVTILQFIRVIFGLGCLPWLICLADKIGKGGAARVAKEESTALKAMGKTHRTAFIPYIPALCIGSAAGLLGRISGVAAGTISFSMLAVAMLNIYGKAGAMPDWLRNAAQVLCGCCIGIRVGPEQIRNLPQLILPAGILCAGYLLLCIFGGYMISKVFKFRFKEAMLFLAPAGAVEMSFIAADMGINSPALALLQMFRLMSVVLLFPQIFYLVVYVL